MNKKHKLIINKEKKENLSEKRILLCATVAKTTTHLYLYFGNG